MDRSSPSAAAARPRFYAALPLAVLLAGVIAPEAASAHGSLISPAARSYMCNFLEPDNVICDQIWTDNPDALLQWMDIAIPDADGRHEEIIPDGQLCSAGLTAYSDLDQASGDWPTTTLEKNSAGLYELVYEETAPHEAEYFRFYLTKQGFDITQPLTWDDLDLIHDSGPLDADAMMLFEFDIPQRYGHHVLYTIWQRSATPEAYYACSDVDFGNILTGIQPAASEVAPKWSPAVAYRAGDLVSHGGETYRALRGSLGSAPSRFRAQSWRRVEEP